MLAYYGGDNGTGIDYAGQEHRGQAARSAAATRPARRSRSTRWRRRSTRASRSSRTGTPTRRSGRTAPSSRSATPAGRQRRRLPATNCTLAGCRRSSRYNVPFYQITEKIGADKVSTWPRRPASPRCGTTATGKALRPDQDRRRTSSRAALRRRSASAQYPITVLDHANGSPPSPTAASTTRPHFVVIECEKTGHEDRQVGASAEHRREAQGRSGASSREVADEVNDVLQEIPGEQRHG